MIRAVLTVTGDVQEAGYRAYVMKNAQKLGLVGYVENLLDGTVRVVAEGEKECIEKFVDLIKIKDETIDVESVETKYETATGEFDGKGFRPKISDADYEMFQGYATAGKYFKIMFKKQDKALDKQDKMLEKQDETTSAIKGLDKKQDKTIEVIGNRFDDMDVKYGDISKTISSMNEKLDRLTNLFEKLVNRFVKEG